MVCDCGVPKLETEDTFAHSSLLPSVPGCESHITDHVTASPKKPTAAPGRDKQSVTTAEPVTIHGPDMTTEVVSPRNLADPQDSGE